MAVITLTFQNMVYIPSHNLCVEGNKIAWFNNALKLPKKCLLSSSLPAFLCPTRKTIVTLELTKGTYARAYNCD